MTITQTVDIPANHRLTIDVPREVPAGPVILTFTPAAAKKPVNQRFAEPALKSADERASPHPNSDALFALLPQYAARLTLMKSARNGSWLNT